MAHLELRSDKHAASLFSARRRHYANWGKRTVDLILALLLLPFIAPVIALICLVVRRSGVPALYAHRRIGQRGVPFTCWKIRTMVPDADARLETYLAAHPDAAAEWARTQKLKNDPRVTQFGRLLRRISLDELPQIWNVLRGDMSLVGPRPVTEPELDRYGPHAQTYLSLKPGVTGHWQVHGRSNGCYAERLHMDQIYASHIGLWHDLQLIWRTAIVLIRPTGR